MVDPVWPAKEAFASVKNRDLKFWLLTFTGSFHVWTLQPVKYEKGQNNVHKPVAIRFPAEIYSPTDIFNNGESKER